MLSAWMVQVSVDWLHAKLEEWQVSMSTGRKAPILARMVIVVNLQPSKANIHIIEYFGHRMKKWLLAVGIILILGLAATYLLIPSRLNIVVLLPVKCNVDAADRSLRDTGN